LIKNFNYYIKTKSKNEKKEEADRKEEKEKAEHNELTSDLSKILKPHDKERN
jgi:hypothetical protein